MVIERILQRGYEEDRRRRFSQSVQDVLFELQKLESSAVFGPRYHMNTSGGQPIAVSLIFADEDLNDTSFRRSLFLIACDASNAVVGIRRAWLHPSDDIIKATGRIDIDFGTKGVSTVIELVHADVMQREADASEIKVIEEALNVNEGDREFLKRLYFDNHALFKEMPQLLIEKDQEQERWQFQWGENGQLGYIPMSGYGNLVKVYSPSVDSPLSNNFAQLDDVHLRRVNFVRNGRFLVTGEVVAGGNVLEAKQEERNQFFKDVLLPNMEEVAYRFNTVPFQKVPKPVF